MDRNFAHCIDDAGDSCALFRRFGMVGRGQVNAPKAMNALAIDHHRVLPGHCTEDAGY